MKKNTQNTRLTLPVIPRNLTKSDSFERFFNSTSATVNFAATRDRHLKHTSSPLKSKPSLSKIAVNKKKKKSQNCYRKKSVAPISIPKISRLSADWQFHLRDCVCVTRVRRVKMSESIFLRLCIYMFSLSRRVKSESGRWSFLSYCRACASARDESKRRKRNRQI